jgi:hypothetical protein
MPGTTLVLPLRSRSTRLACQASVMQGAGRTNFSVFLRARGRLPSKAHFAMTHQHLRGGVIIMRVGTRKAFVNFRGGDIHLADLVMGVYVTCRV